MNTETTETIKGYIFYDANCAFCKSWVIRTHTFVMTLGFHFVPMQADWALDAIGVKTIEHIQEMKLLTSNDELYGGVDAFVHVCREAWYLMPVAILLNLPGINHLAKWIYRMIARNRHCLGGVCAIERHLQQGKGRVKRVFLDSSF